MAATDIGTGASITFQSQTKIVLGARIAPGDLIVVAEQYHRFGEYFAGSLEAPECLGKTEFAGALPLEQAHQVRKYVFPGTTALRHAVGVGLT